MKELIADIFISLQSGLSVYVLYLLILYKKGIKASIFYILTMVLFILLKFEVIYLTPKSILDYMVWWTYNILNYLFIIIFLIKKNNGKINHNTNF